MLFRNPLHYSIAGGNMRIAEKNNNLATLLYHLAIPVADIKYSIVLQHAHKLDKAILHKVCMGECAPGCCSK